MINEKIASILARCPVFLRKSSVYKPTLFLEMHGETMGEKRRKVAEIVSFLWEINYGRIRHIETGTTIAPENTSVEWNAICTARRPDPPALFSLDGSLAA